MNYRYLAYTNDRKMVKGTIESASLAIAEAGLYRAGFKRILQLQPAGPKIDFRKVFFGESRVNRQALLDFTNELAILIESGLTLLMGLKQLEKQSSDSSLKKVVVRLAADLQAGTPFHQALSRHPRVFSEAYYSIIQANEQAGTLDAGLRQIARELKQQIELRSQIQKAVTQPAIIVVLAIGVIILLSIVVLPPLADIFRQFGAKLPLTTRALIGFSDFVSHNKYYLLLGIFFLALIISLLWRMPSTKRAFHRLILKAPLFGIIMVWHNTARFSRTTSNLLEAGILLPDAINIMLRTIENTYFREALTGVRKQLVQGQALSAALGSDKLFPPLLVEMAAVGEASGRLENSLGTVADYFESKTEKRINRLTSLLEPALILGVGLIVGLIAISMISTIYGLVGNFNAG